MRKKQVGAGDGIHLMKNELILSTKNAFFIECGVLGAVRGVNKYPLRNLIICNNSPQAFYRRNA